MCGGETGTREVFEIIRRGYKTGYTLLSERKGTPITNWREYT